MLYTFCTILLQYLCGYLWLCLCGCVLLVLFLCGFGHVCGWALGWVWESEGVTGCAIGFGRRRSGAVFGKIEECSVEEVKGM